MKSVLFSLAIFFAKTAYGQECLGAESAGSCGPCGAACEADDTCRAVMAACDSDCTGDTCRDDCGPGSLTAIGADGGEAGAALLACRSAPDPDQEAEPCEFGDGDSAALEMACTWDADCSAIQETMPRGGPPLQAWLDSSGW